MVNIVHLISQSKRLRSLLFTCVALSLSACSLMPGNKETSAPAKSELSFVDLQGFDKEMHSAFSQPLPKVEVAFYNPLTPNALPDRLQNWMAAVETGGGTVKVISPKSSVTPKDPFLLFTLASTLWSASKTAREMSNSSRFNSVQGYDAEIQLKVDDKGTSVVDKVVFVKRPEQSK